MLGLQRTNRRTIADRHPLSKVQTTLENLEKSSWFSFLDKEKAYYQRFMETADQHKTAFIPYGVGMNAMGANPFLV